MNKTRRSLASSVIAMLLCFAMLLGTTYAWFTDSAVSGGNIIQSGNLDVEMYWSETLLAADSGEWKNADGVPIFTYDNWEPGYTDVKYIKIKNAGNLSLQWRLSIEAEGAVGELAKAIDVYYVNPVTEEVTALALPASVGVLSDVLSNHTYTSGVLLPAGEVSSTYTAGETVLAVAFHMDQDAGNGYQGKSIGDGFSVSLMATQFNYESDGFNNKDYDKNSQWPNNVIVGGNSASAPVVPDANNKVSSEVALLSGDGKINANVPAGVQLTAGVNTLTLNVNDVADSKANLTLSETEASMSIDVHINGVAENNEVVMAIGIKELLPVGLNMGSHRFYHVENGETVEMTLLADGVAPVHNNYEYDPNTGDVVLYLKSFSEVALVADKENAWEGNFDYSWYTNAVAPVDGENVTEYTIANADQLAAFGAIVGGMNGQTQDSFAGKTVKLLADINLGDKESENNPNLIFYPIGYYNSTGSYEKTGGGSVTSSVSSFEGTFDGNGNTIKNFYQNTWEMFGDYNDGYSGTPNHYKDAMGLFGYVLNGTVKNLTVSNFSSDGEFTPTGVIAAYVDCNSTFENIAITNCNPRVYNTGNGGIIGIAGDTSAANDDHITLKNITVDNSNKISALWGSWDVACGGLVGMYRGNVDGSGNATGDTISFENCHVSAIIDVYNDVCANYQYYAYRYSGMIIGSVRHNTKNAEGKTIPDMTGISAEECTVHFGTWNDYYYCEIIDNTTASYTHDYQMSRLVEIKAINGTEITYLDGTTGTVPASGRANYVIVDYSKGHGTANATCYHFKDGKVWNHSDAGTETVDGVEVLVEDKQHLYLEFSNLFTGYGWGVSSMAINKWNGITALDVEEGEHEESVNKFKPSINEKSEIATESTVTIGELFAAIENADVAINSDNVQVTVSPFGATSTAGGTYAANTTDWTKGTLTFSGMGEAVITITDYYFCNTTTVTVTIVGAEKFDTHFVNYKDYLYRVGSADGGTVALGTIFKHSGKGTINSAKVTVAIEKIAGNATGEVTANNTDWTKGTIQFSGTGVVKVTIQDDTSKEFVLNLEVVDATNITKASGGTDKKLVLLNDVTYSDGYLYYYKSTLYGNGFKIDITGAAHSDLKDSSDKDSNRSAYCNIWMVDSCFDNVKIVGSVYPEVGMTADSNYGNAAIRTEGNCYITNSYISNCRVPLRIQGDTTLVDTVVDGGRYANIELRSGKLTLDGVTTINTVRKGSDGTTEVIGFGIVIHAEATNASIAVKGDGLKQYNWVGESEHKTILSKDTNLSSAYKLIFNANNNDRIYFDKNNDRYVSTGILCLCEDIGKDVVTGLDDRYYQTVSGYNAWVLTYDNSKHTTWFNESIGIGTVTPDHKQHPVIPTYTGSEAQTVEFTKGETYYFDTSVLKAEKFGQSLKISSVVMNGNQYNYGEKIAITEGGVYEIVYTVVDPYNYMADASTVMAEHTVSITLTAVAKDAEILAPKFTFIDQNGNKYESTTVKVGDKTYVMPNVTAADPTTNSMSSINIGSASIDGKVVYFPIAQGYTVRSGSNFNRYYPLFNGINITDYTIAGDTTGTIYTTSGNYTSHVGSSGTKFIIPENGKQTNCGDYVKTNGQAGNAAGNSDSGWQGSGYSTSYGGTYLKSGNTNASSGADKNGYERIVWVEYCFNAGNGDVYYYRIGYHCNKESAQSCITPDTLVTLADGTQIRVDALTGNEELLVWNHETGKLDKAPVAYIVDHDGVVSEHEVIHLNFANGKTVKIIGEHVFYDATLNKYVAVNAENVDSFIGHTFAALGNDGETVETVELRSIRREIVKTAIYEVVSYKHLTCFTEGILSTSAYLDPLLNVFDIDADTFAYDAESVQKDIETYGLYTYADFEELISEEAFDLYNAKYLKIAVGKGYITWDDILTMIDIYFGVDVQPIQ